MVFESTVTAVRQREEIPEPCVYLFIGEIGLDFPLMVDNVKPHRAHIVTEFLDKVRIFTGLFDHQISRLQCNDALWREIGGNSKTPSVNHSILEKQCCFKNGSKCPRNS
ncbi:hypothetical protein TNCV_2184501 [Trichonephila clavipes]|nr:hypothetical protein TNCV_2184501 [Trichonephila clavipes]